MIGLLPPSSKETGCGIKKVEDSHSDPKNIGRKKKIDTWKKQ